MMQVHQGRAAAPPRGAGFSGRASLHRGPGWLVEQDRRSDPEGIVLEINEVPLAEARVRREEVIGYPLAETRWWSCSPTSQAQLCAAIARASRGETVRFEAVVHLREGLDRHLEVAEVAITPHRDVDHHIAYLVIVGTDITDQSLINHGYLRNSHDYNENTYNA